MGENMVILTPRESQGYRRIRGAATHVIKGEAPRLNKSLVDLLTTNGDEADRFTEEEAKSCLEGLRRKHVIAPMRTNLKIAGGAEPLPYVVGEKSHLAKTLFAVYEVKYEVKEAPKVPKATKKTVRLEPEEVIQVLGELRKKAQNGVYSGGMRTIMIDAGIKPGDAARHKAIREFLIKAGLVKLLRRDEYEIVMENGENLIPNDPFDYTYKITVHRNRATKTDQTEPTAPPPAPEPVAVESAPPENVSDAELITWLREQAKRCIKLADQLEAAGSAREMALDLKAKRETIQ